MSWTLRNSRTESSALTGFRHEDLNHRASKRLNSDHNGGGRRRTAAELTDGRGMTVDCSSMRLVVCVAGVAAIATAAAGQSDRVSFNRDVRPIMSDTCFRCHGPDRNARKADMRLDVREQATEPTRSGRTPIVPGDPD